MEEINSVIGQQQIEYINSTIELIENNDPEKLNKLIKTNVQKCVNWCIKYKIPHIKINSELCDYEEQQII